MNIGSSEGGRSLIPKSLSLKGAQFIGRFEGFRSTWYRDAVGVRTVGYGHTGELPRGFTVPLSITEGELLLRHDAAACARVVSEIRPRILRQTRFDALCSFAFNLGVGIFDPSHDIGKAVRKRIGRDRAVEKAILEYDRAGGHVLPGLLRRREAEMKLWKTGSYR